MKRVLLVPILLLALIQTPAMAMGSGDKYVDAQTGLSYQIYRPTFTADLLIRSFKLLSCGPKQEKWLAAIYGEDREIQILETDAAARCSDPGLGVQVATATINGAKAKIIAFCDPTKPNAFKNCKTSDIKSVGGYAMWTTKPTKFLHGSSVEVLVTGFTYSQLLQVARGLKLV